MAKNDTGRQQMSQLFLQSAYVIVDKNQIEIPRSMITTASYMEVMNMKSPVLQLKIRDVTNHVTNEIGIKPGSRVAVTMGGGVSQNGEVWAETMAVVSMPYSGDVLTMNLVPEALQTLCQPAPKPAFFVEQQPLTILRALVPPGIRLVPDAFPRMMTYHLNMMQKPTSLITGMATDNGARAWLARGSLNLRVLTALNSQKPVFTYEMNNPQAERTLTRMSAINQDATFLDKVRFRFTGYSETEGFISVGNPAYPVKQVSHADRASLRNQLYTLIPKLDAECEGNEALTPGMMLSVVIHRYNSESGLDESLPKNMIVMSVTHHEDRRAYVCRMILGVVESA